jgi:PAS domain S-box-containing protein
MQAESTMIAAATSLHASMIGDRYRLLVDAITDYAILMLDDRGFISSWNAGAQRSFGYLEEEILGKHFSIFYPAEDRDAGIPEKAMAIAASEARYETEGWRLRKDGTRFWAHVIIDAIRDPKGQLLGFAKVTRDLSERKAAEAELQSSAEQFRRLVQSVADYAIYMLDPTGKVSSWNLGAQRIKGYSADEIIGQHFSKFYTEEDRADNLPRKALETAATEGRLEKEGWRVRKDGTRFWASVIIDTIRSPEGELLGFAKVTRDITEKKEAQRALDQAREELFQAQKMEAVGQLTGGVAHDFNNLLMAVLGSLEIARKRALEGRDVVRLIDNAIMGARRGASLTQRLLAFARKQELELQPVDIPELVRGMTEMLQRSIGPAIQIRTDFPLGLPKIQSDKNQLENALLNLTVNARDAMPDGGQIRITAEARQVAAGDIQGLKAGRYVCLSVEDQGEGMDAETLEASTTPFFTTKGIGKGTGLGLPMVQGLMAQSGGKLLLRSEKGRGTAAELWLPQATGTPSEPKVPDKEATMEMRPLVALAVDDDALVLMNTVLMLEDLGHTAMQAQSADEALRILEQTPAIELVITDHAMPRMTGVQLAEEIAKLRPDVRVILATGYAELPTHAGACLARLTKPFTQDQLAATLAKAMA